MNRSSKLPQLLLALSCVAVLGVVAYFFTRTGTDASSTVAPVAVVGPGDVGVAPAGATELAAVPVKEGAAPERAVAPPVRVTTSATPTDGELANAWWVEGRVRLPDGTPLDESVVVIAQGREFASQRLHQSPLKPDGSFRVAFSKETKKAWLRLDSRYVFLPETVAVDASKEPRDVELAPQLGGCVRGRLVPSAAGAAFAKDLVGATVAMQGWRGRISGPPRQTSAKVEANLEFELGGLDPDARWTLSLGPKTFAATSLEAVLVSAGKVTPLDVPIERGAELAGRVTDESGAPVEGASIRLDRTIHFNMGVSGVDAVKTDADGRFKMFPVPTDAARIGAVKAGFASTVLADLKLKDGETRAGVDFVLTRGLSIEGSVTWPDGKPAGDVRVKADRTAGGEYWWLREEEPFTRSNADGTFQLVGLREGEYDLEAQASAKAAQAAEESAGGAQGKKAKKGKPTASRPAVAAGARDVRLVLGAGGAVRGRVVDDLGAPVTTFSVITTPVKQHENWTQREAPSTRGFKSEDGRFELGGLSEGTFEIAVATKSAQETEPVTVSLPGDVAPLEFRLPRLAQIRGRVVDPDGVAVENALIEVDLLDTNARSWKYDNKTEKSRRTDAEGQFSFEYVPGEWQVSAHAPTWAASAEVTITAAPASQVGPLTLTLQRGGTITGEARDDAGEPAVARQVNLNGPGDSREATTDAQGRFRFERVSAGEWSVNLQPSREAYREAERAKNYDWNSLQPLRGRAVVTVEEGGTHHVVLGGVAQSLVRVTGVVTADRPLEGVYVQVRPIKADGQSDFQASRAGRTDAEGRYSVSIDGPGSYSILVSQTSGAWMEKRFEIPAAPTFVADFHLPSGRISGVVLGADGKRIKGARVSAMRTGGVKSLEGDPNEARVGSGYATTDAEGAFTIECQPEGQYTLTASLSRTGNARKNTDASDAPARREGIELKEGGHVTGIELRMRPGGTITGIVTRPDGSPMPRAMVIARSTSVDPFSFSHQSATTSGAGRFEVSGLPAGDHVVYAFEGQLVSAVARAVPVRAGAVETVDLRLEAGASLKVAVVDTQGRPAPAPLFVRDSSGVDWGQMIEGPDDLGEPYWVRPLPAGSYVVSLGAKAPSSSVELSAGATREMRLEVPQAPPAATPK